MPYRIERIPELELTIITLEGEVGFDDFLGQRRENFALGVQKLEIVDIRQAKLQDYTADNLMNMPSMDTVNGQKYVPEPGSKTAVLVKSIAEVGMMRMFENVIKSQEDDWPREFRAFYTLEEAYEWLCLYRVDLAGFGLNSQ